MKHIFLSFLSTAVLFTAGQLCAQNNVPHLKVYKNALKSGDAQLAVTALGYLVAEEPTTVYRDTLAMLYMQLRQPATALYWINQRLAEKPVNAIALKEERAQCLEAIGNGPAAITAWQELAIGSPINAGYRFLLANAQYSMKRQGETLETIAQLEKMPNDTLKQVSYSVDNGQTVQYTSIAAASANMKGLVLYEMHRTNEAKVAFAQAQQIDKAYLLPTNNLAAIAQEEKKNQAPPQEKKLGNKG